MSVLFSLLALAATFLTCETYIDGYGNNQNYNYNQAYYDWYQKYYASYYAQQQQATAAPQPAAATPDPDWTYTCVTAPPAAYNLCTYGSHAYMPLKEVFKDNPFVMAILNG